MIIMKYKRNTPLCANSIPDYAHNIIVFLTSSLYLQDTIYTKQSKKNTEQWIELVVRFYLYDKHLNEKQNTFTMLKKLKNKVHEMIICAFQFEHLLHQTKTEKMKHLEIKIEQEWKTIYDQMSKQVKHKSKKKKVKQTKKKSFA